MISELCKKAERKGPDDAGEDYDDKIADGISHGCSKKGIERCFCKALDENNRSNAQNQLQDLRPPYRMCFIAEPFLIDDIDDEHCNDHTKQLRGVFLGTFEILRIGIGREGKEVDEQKYAQGDCKNCNHCSVNDPRAFVFSHHERIEHKNEDGTEQKGSQDICGGVYTEIKTGKCNQNQNGN